MKKDFRIGTIVFLVVLLILLVGASYSDILKHRAYFAFTAFAWTWIWRGSAWRSLRHEIAEIFELTGETKNTGQDIPDIVRRLDRNAGDPLLRAVINTRINQMIGTHAWTARKILGEVSELFMTQGGKFQLSVELETYTKLAEKLWDEELDHKIKHTKHPPDVAFALIGRIAVRELTGQIPTELSAYYKFVKYFEGLSAEVQQKILIDGSDWATKETGESNLKEKWEAVMKELRKKFWSTKASAST